MLKWMSLGLLLVPTESWAVADTNHKKKEIYIESGLPQSPTDEKHPHQPFFAESTGVETMEEIEELKQELSDLKKRVTELEKKADKK